MQEIYSLLGYMKQYGNKEKNVTHLSFMILFWKYYKALPMKRPIKMISGKGKTRVKTRCLKKHGDSQKMEIGGLSESEYTQLEGIDERWGFLVYHLEFILKVIENTWDVILFVANPIWALPRNSGTRSFSLANEYYNIFTIHPCKSEIHTYFL